MAFRSTRPKFEKIESNDAESMEDAFQGALGEIEARELTSDNDSPPVTIILSNAIPGDDGQRINYCAVYIGATPEEVTNDLLTQQKA